jgi:hypothetical protein
MIIAKTKNAKRLTNNNKHVVANVHLDFKRV